MVALCLVAGTVATANGQEHGGFGSKLDVTEHWKRLSPALAAKVASKAAKVAEPSRDGKSLRNTFPFNAHNGDHSHDHGTI